METIGKWMRFAESRDEDQNFVEIIPKMMVVDIY